MATKIETWTIVTLQGFLGQQSSVSGQAIGVGDSVQVVIWETATGGLVSAPAKDRMGTGSLSATIPEQVVGPDGAITVPYAGRMRFWGRKAI